MPRAKTINYQRTIYSSSQHARKSKFLFLFPSRCYYVLIHFSAHVLPHHVDSVSVHMQIPEQIPLGLCRRAAYKIRWRDSINAAIERRWRRRGWPSGSHPRAVEKSGETRMLWTALINDYREGKMAKSSSVESVCIVNAGAEKKRFKKRGLVHHSTAIFPSELTKVRSSGCDLFCFYISWSAAASSLIIDFICLPNFAKYRDISRR